MNLLRLKLKSDEETIIEDSKDNISEDEDNDNITGILDTKNHKVFTNNLTTIN